MDFYDLYREVIGRGLCTGCGTCAGICPTKGVEMVYVDHEPEPRLSGQCTDCGLCYELCPGQDIPMPALDQMVFGRERQPEKELLGIYQRCVAAHAVDPNIWSAGAAFHIRAVRTHPSLLVNFLLVLKRDHTDQIREKPSQCKNLQIHNSNRSPIAESPASYACHLREVRT